MNFLIEYKTREHPIEVYITHAGHYIALPRVYDYRREGKGTATLEQYGLH